MRARGSIFIIMVTHKKDLGQNFLVNKKIIRDLVETAKISENDTVLEIGAGTGNVTKEIAKRAGKIFAVEFDRDLIPTLQNNLNDYNNVTILNKDILKINLSQLEFRNSELEISAIVGSIPFQITSPLIHKLFMELQPPHSSNPETRPRKTPSTINREGVEEAAEPHMNNSPPPTITILIQKEVAEKITAEPPNANYLSNFVRGLANVTYIQRISKTAFNPQPKVDGAIIKIMPHYNVLINYNISPKQWGAFLHKGFRYPRKMLRNTFDETALKKANINPRSRPQELRLNQWVALYKTISQ